jgi:NitT/TauT family transport system ATP-binding protein
LLPWKTVIENVCLPGKILKRDPDETRKRAERMLDLVGLSGFLNAYPNQLSGGMAQRAGIARGLAQDPAVMLMDEPFGALDAMTRERMNLDLLDIWTETRKTIVFITHSIAEAVLLADRVVVMSSRPGKVVDIIDIDLPRPRTMAMASTEPFGKYTAYLRGCFNATGDL